MRSGNEKQHDQSGKSKASRREFLKQTATAPMVTIAAGSLGFTMEPTRKKVRIGVVGGGFGCEFQWHEHPDCIVEAVSDLRPDRRERLMNTYRCANAYPSLEEMVKDSKIDAVAVFTDGPLHVRHTVECMKAGKHVLSAVPAAWGTIEEAEQLLYTVRKHGLVYMMAETGYYQQSTISARKFFQEGRFGQLYYCEAEYQHPGLEALYIVNGKRTWRYGVAPMHYPTHTTSQLVSVTGERLMEAVCHGWGDEDPMLKDNPYRNPFWNESAMFRTSGGHAFRANIWWRGAHRGCERAQWIGDKISFFGPHPNGLPAVIVHAGKLTEKDDGGFSRQASELEKYQQMEWWNTELLPEPLRHKSGHEGSHTFLTHEFIDAIVQRRRPAIDVYEALDYTVPGIIAHLSALEKGKSRKIPQYSRPA